MKNDFVLIIEYDINSCYDGYEMYFVEQICDNWDDFIKSYNIISKDYKRYKCYFKQLSSGIKKEISNDYINALSRKIQSCL